MLIMEGKRVIIAGGSGLIGGYLARHLKRKGYDVALLSRGKATSTPYKTYTWNPDGGKQNIEALDGAFAVINLAGTNVAGGLWTKSFKKNIYDSRINATRTLVSAINQSKEKPTHFISASAVGFYGSGDETMTEEREAGSDFLARVCHDWEVEALKLQNDTTKVSIIRTGIVLANTGGFLEKIASSVRWRLGCQIGNGKQIISWIHILDLVRIFTQIIDETLQPGIYNGVSPNPKSNREMIEAIAYSVKKPILLPPVPAFVLKIVLGEFSTELLTNHRISAEKLVKSGFGFQFPDLPAALEDLLNPR